ncbi:cation transporter dimerization domain-containing protein, partial [Stenotrophomonas maltophilia]
MEGTPENVEVDKVTEKILSTEGVNGIHDLHIWTITSGLNALTCHAVVDEKMTIGESEMLVRKIEHELE